MSRSFLGGPFVAAFLRRLLSAAGAAILSVLVGCADSGRWALGVRTPTIEVTFDGSTGQASLGGNVGSIDVVAGDATLSGR